jgi:hypothetical protein
MVGLGPRLPKSNEVLTAALGAGAVARGQCRDLVQEEELGEPAGTKERAAPPFELEPARDPPADLPVAYQVPLFVVEDAAVCEEQPPRLCGDDVAERCDPVASRHGLDMVREGSRVPALGGSYGMVSDSRSPPL